MTAHPPHTIPFHKASIGQEEIQAVTETLQSGRLTIDPKTLKSTKIDPNSLIHLNNTASLVPSILSPSTNTPITKKPMAITTKTIRLPIRFSNRVYHFPFTPTLVQTNKPISSIHSLHLPPHKHPLRHVFQTITRWLPFLNWHTHTLPSFTNPRIDIFNLTKSDRN